MGWNYHLDGTITVPPAREQDALAAIRAAYLDIYGGNTPEDAARAAEDWDGSPHDMLEDVLRAAFNDGDVVTLADETEGVYRFNDWTRADDWQDALLEALAPFGWGTLTCSGEDDTYWKLVLTGGECHNVPGEITYHGLDALTLAVDPVTGQPMGVN